MKVSDSSWGYPQFSSICRWIFQPINHPAIGIPPISEHLHSGKFFEPTRLAVCFIRDWTRGGLPEKSTNP